MAEKPVKAELDFRNLDDLFKRGRRWPIEPPPKRPLRPGRGLPPEEPRFDPRHLIPGTRDYPRHWRPIDRDWQIPPSLPSQTTSETGLQAAPSFMERLAQLLTGQQAQLALRQAMYDVPFGGGITPAMARIPSPIRVPLFGYNISKLERSALERGMKMLDQRIPGWRRLAGSGRGQGSDVRIVPRPLGEDYGQISGPNALGVYNLAVDKGILPRTPDVAATILHEMTHIPVSKLGSAASTRAEFVPPVQRLANVASQQLPIDERLRIGMSYPQDPKSEYLEELVTSLLSRKSIAKRLGLPSWPTSGELPLGGRDPSIPLTFEERMWKLPSQSSSY